MIIMKKKETITIDVRPVAWHDGEVGKYQAFAHVGERLVCAGEPRITEEGARVQLRLELQLRVDEMKAIIEQMEKEEADAAGTAISKD